MATRTSIFDLSLEQLIQTMEEWGEPSYRGKQIWRGVYHRLTTKADALTEISTKLRKQIELGLPLSNNQITRIR